MKSLSWRPPDHFAHLGYTVVCVGIYVFRSFVFVILFLDLRLELKSCTLRGRGIVSHTLMTSLKGHGSLQNVPPHVLQDDYADYEAVADSPVDGRGLHFA